MRWLSCIGAPRTSERAERIGAEVGRETTAVPRSVDRPTDVVVPIRDLTPFVDRMVPFVQRLKDGAETNGAASMTTVGNLFRVGGALRARLPHIARGGPERGAADRAALESGHAPVSGATHASDPPLKRAPVAAGETSDVRQAFYGA